MSKLIFVYNADAGFFNMISDIAHKIFSPSTYPCRLCDLTYGILKVRPEWEEFVENAAVPFEFLHKDEFHTHFPGMETRPLPAVFQKGENGALTEIISPEQLAAMQTLDELKRLVLMRLSRPDPRYAPPAERS